MLQICTLQAFLKIHIHSCVPPDTSVDIMAVKLPHCGTTRGTFYGLLPSHAIQIIEVSSIRYKLYSENKAIICLLVERGKEY